MKRAARRLSRRALFETTRRRAGWLPARRELRLLETGISRGRVDVKCLMFATRGKKLADSRRRVEARVASARRPTKIAGKACAALVVLDARQRRAGAGMLFVAGVRRRVKGR